MVIFYMASFHRTLWSQSDKEKNKNIEVDTEGHRMEKVVLQDSLLRWQ